MRSINVFLVISLSGMVFFATTASNTSSGVTVNLMQDVGEPALMASNFADVNVDADLSEWSSYELQKLNTISYSDRERNTSFVFQVAFNQTHYFGHLEIEDDAIFDAFPFRANETKVADGFHLEVHDAARTTIHDGFEWMIVDKNYEDEILDAYGIVEDNNAIATDFESVPGTTLAISDLDYMDDESWNVSMLDSIHKSV